MKAFMPTPETFTPKEHETADEIALDLITPGFLQNRLIASEKGEEFVQASRDLLHKNIDYLIQTPKGAETRGNGQELVEAQLNVNRLVSDFMISRISKFSNAIIAEGVDKYIEWAKSEEQIDELAKQVEGDELFEAMKKGVEEGKAEFLKINGALKKVLMFWANVAGHQKFAEYQAEAMEALPPHLKGYSIEMATLVATVGAIVTAFSVRMNEENKVHFALSSMAEMLSAARDQIVITSIVSPAPIENLFLTRMSYLVDQVVKDKEGCGDEACESCNEQKAEEPGGNVVQFPTSKTVH